MVSVKENWKPVVGFEGYYEVSDQGQVRGVRRMGSHGKCLSQQTTAEGYKRVNLYANGVYKKKRVHHLVLEAHVGPCPEGMEGRHLDGDPGNNAVGNLRWGTHSENLWDRSPMDRPWYKRLTEEEIQEIIEHYELDKRMLVYR